MYKKLAYSFVEIAYIETANLDFDKLVSDDDLIAKYIDEDNNLREEDLSE